jgi:hypothetical protein
VSRQGFERGVAAVAAGIVLCLVLAMTAFLAIPVFGPLDQEFGWSKPALGLCAAASVAATIAVWSRAIAFIRLTSVRATAVGAAACCAGVLLLILPNLTHLWQFGLALTVLGLARAGVCAPCWVELRCRFRTLGALAGLAAAAAVALFALTPAMDDLVYRSDWREGCAAAGGAMLLLAATIAYVLFPGPEGGVAHSATTDDRAPAEFDEPESNAQR